jgi:hypothetical protein
MGRAARATLQSLEWFLREGKISMKLFAEITIKRTAATAVPTESGRRPYIGPQGTGKQSPSLMNMTKAPLPDRTASDVFGFQAYREEDGEKAIAGAQNQEKRPQEKSAHRYSGNNSHTCRAVSRPTAYGRGRPR